MRDGPGASRCGILHDHDFGDVAELAEVLAQALGRRLPAQTADEHFPAVDEINKSINQRTTPPTKKR